MSKKIINLKKYFEEGWQWEWDGSEYRTNKEGCGLWEDGKQIIGTCDIKFKQKTISALRKAIKREMEK